MTEYEAVNDAFDVDRIEAIAARLDLRQPNKEALESIASEIARHYVIDREPPPCEAVVDVATGVGKTYVLAATIEYLAGEGVRNFAIITPGRTILDKTVANFTPGHPKSLLGGMEVRPVVITSENFATPAMRAAMDDAEQVKLFIFTVQALTAPKSTVHRRTHKFQEGLGEAFYAHLQRLDDLVVFADEHHTYYGAAFSKAVRDLRPRVLLGLTATPHKKTPPDQIVFRYPLAAAIADRLVKTPVLVGRQDDRTDPHTKLLDGVRLLEMKERLIDCWCQETGMEPVTPVMLVIASSIADAEEITAIVADDAFAGGRYADKVLTVHSDAPDAALAQLDRLEDRENPYRVVISVGMLKEGWDVKNVYVIASLRASVSDILTEQTLGRGLRLPFGRYTGIEFLDTLEVLGHERYDDLLRKAGVFNEQFIDRRTRAILRRDADGRLVPAIETTEVRAPIAVSTEMAPPGAADAEETRTASGIAIQSVERQTAQAERLLRLHVEVAPRTDLCRVRVPRLRMTTITNAFSLADITDLDPFRRLGERIAADPAGGLRRVTLGARIVVGADGLRRTELVPARARDRVESPAPLLSLDMVRQELIARVLAAPVVPARPSEVWPAGEIVDAVLRGIGPNAERVLSDHLDRAAAGLIDLITEEQRMVAGKPAFGEVVELVDFAKTRRAPAETSDDRFVAFRKGAGYRYRKSLYPQDWFDSSTERAVANLLEDEAEIACWVRLHVGDVPILWSDGREYNPDFVAVEQDEAHWLIEVKMDKEMATPDVQAKREAARRWASHVNADGSAGVRWNYLLVSEADVSTAKGSWPALKVLGN